jgi:hypothetical protein
MEEKEVQEQEAPQEEEFNLEEFLDLKDEDTAETIAVKVQEKLGTSLGHMQEALSKSLMERAEEMTLEMVNIAPHGDYDKLIEDNDGMAEFLKTEAHKPENWKLYGIRVSDVKKDLLSFVFANMAIDQGDSMSGYVFVSKAGKIKHAFATVEQ